MTMHLHAQVPTLISFRWVFSTDEGGANVIVQKMSICVYNDDNTKTDIDLDLKGQWLLLWQVRYNFIMVCLYM